MAVSTSTAFALTLETFARDAMRTAGVLGVNEDASGEEVQEVADWVDLELNEWQAAGRLLRQVERVTTTLTAGTATVTIASDTINVEFPAYITPSSGTATYQVKRMTVDDYMKLSEKTTQGIPNRALIERKDTVVMTLHPVPDSSVTSISYVRYKLITDTTAGTNPNIHKRYLKALVLAVAVHLAESKGKSGDKIDRLEARAIASKRIVDRDNTEKGPLRFSL